MACEVLISRASSLAFGEIVRVEAPGFAWGKMETLSAWLADDPANTAANWPGTFFLLKVQGGLTVEEARAMRWTKHLWRILDNNNVKAQLESDGEATVPSGPFNNALRDKAPQQSVEITLYDKPSRFQPANVPANRGTTGEPEPYVRHMDRLGGKRTPG